MTKTYPTCDLRYEVKFAREGAPTQAIHVVLRVKYAQKPTTTLCGVPVNGLQITMPHDLGANRPVLGANIPADPFFGPLGCETCAQRMSF